MVTELLKACELPKTDCKIAKFLRQIMSAGQGMHRSIREPKRYDDSTDGMWSANSV